MNRCLNIIVHLGLGLNLSAILWRCFTKLIVFEAVKKVLHSYTSFFHMCQRYRNMHLHSSVYHCCYLALRSLVARYEYFIAIYCTKNKLNKNAYLLVFCLSLRIASRCNFNALLLVNLIKCFCSKAISIWLHFMGRINIRTRVNATCVRALWSKHVSLSFRCYLDYIMFRAVRCECFSLLKLISKEWLYLRNHCSSYKTFRCISMLMQYICGYRALVCTSVLKTQ